MSNTMIRCRSIQYRQGFIEVCPGIHDSLVNLETWNVDSERLLGDTSTLSDESYAVTSNCELELTPDEAMLLARALMDAAEAMQVR